MSLRETHKEDRRRQILRAARGLLAGERRSEVSVRAIAGAAGLSVATVYNLWGSKGAVLHALHSPYIEALERELAAPEPRGCARARRIVEVSIELYARDAPYTQRLLAELLAEDEEPLGGEVLARCVRWQERALLEARAAGELRGELGRTALAWQILSGYVAAMRLWTKGALDLAGFRAQALHALCLALLADATAAGAGTVRAWELACEPELLASLRASKILRPIVATKESV